MEQRLSFAISDVEFIDEVNKLKFSRARVKAFRSGNNAHNKPVSEETLRAKSETIYDCPLVWHFDRYSNDAGSHDPQEVPVGFVPKHSANMQFVETDFGLELHVDVLIWKRYAKKFMEVMQRDGGTKPVSVEMMVFSTNPPLSDGSEELTDFAFTCITVLGTNVLPAIKSANLEIVEFSKDKQLAEEIIVPESIKTEINFDSNSNVRGISFANKVKENNYITFEFANKLYKYIEKNKDQIFSGKFQSWLEKSLIKEGEKLEFSLNSEQILQILNNALSEFKYQSGDDEYHKYWVRDYDTEFAYVYNCELSKLVRMKYILEDTVANIDVESAEEVISGGYIPTNKAEENEEFALPEKEKIKEFCDSMKFTKDDKEESRFSLISYSKAHVFCFDNMEKRFAAIPYSYSEDKFEMNPMECQKVKMSFVVSEDENDDEVTMSIMSMFSADVNTEAVAQVKLEEMKSEYDKSLNELHGQISDLQDQVDKYKAEEDKRNNDAKTSTVDFALKEVEHTIPADELEKLREKANEFTFDNIDQWKNLVFAEGFKYSKNNPTSSWSRIQFPNNDPILKVNSNKSKWHDIETE